jgi:hypothetical protein
MQGRDAITEEDIYAAMENKAMEAYSELTGALKPGVDAGGGTDTFSTHGVQSNCCLTDQQAMQVPGSEQRCRVACKCHPSLAAKYHSDL